jgi:hypothetical protein
MSVFRAPKEEFRSITSNYDSVWVKFFGYHRSTHDIIHTIDNDIKRLVFDTGFHSSNVPTKLFRHIMYRTLDNVSTPVAENSSFVVYSKDFPCKVRLLKYENGGKFNLYRFNTILSKFEPCDEDLREWKLIRHWYKDTVCPLAEKESRFVIVNHHGLQYSRPLLKALPKWMLEDEEVTAMNYVTRIRSDNVIRVNHWVKFAVIFPMSMMMYSFTYFKEYEPTRKRIINAIDPNKMHIANIPRGLMFNMVFAAWLAGISNAF